LFGTGVAVGAAGDWVFEPGAAEDAEGAVDVDVVVCGPVTCNDLIKAIS
jgi:hypothetical protein